MRKNRVFIYILLAAVLCTVLSPPAWCMEDDDVIASCDTAISAVSGSALDSTAAETPLGDLLADAVREETGCDAAIVCGGHVLRSITYGDITTDKVLASVDGRGKAALVHVSPAELWELLETALSRIALDEGEAIDPAASSWAYYPQISGLEIQYDASAPAGERLLAVSCGGTPLDSADQSGTIATALSEEYLSWDVLLQRQAETPERTEAEMLAAYLGDLEVVTAPAANRIRVLGITRSLFADYKLYRYIPYIILILLLAILPRQKRRLRNMDGSLSNRYRTPIR